MGCSWSVGKSSYFDSVGKSSIYCLMCQLAANGFYKNLNSMAIWFKFISGVQSDQFLALKYRITKFKVTASLFALLGKGQHARYLGIASVNLYCLSCCSVA